MLRGLCLVAALASFTAGCLLPLTSTLPLPLPSLGLTPAGVRASMPTDSTHHADFDTYTNDENWYSFSMTQLPNGDILKAVNPGMNGYQVIGYSAASDVVSTWAKINATQLVLAEKKHLMYVVSEDTDGSGQLSAGQLALDAKTNSFPLPGAQVQPLPVDLPAGWGVARMAVQPSTSVVYMILYTKALEWDLKLQLVRWDGTSRTVTKIADNFVFYLQFDPSRQPEILFQFLPQIFFSVSAAGVAYIASLGDGLRHAVSASGRWHSCAEGNGYPVGVRTEKGQEVVYSMFRNDSSTMSLWDSGVIYRSTNPTPLSPEYKPPAGEVRNPRTAPAGVVDCVELSPLVSDIYPIPNQMAPGYSFQQKGDFVYSDDRQSAVHFIDPKHRPEVHKSLAFSFTTAMTFLPNGDLAVVNDQRKDIRKVNTKAQATIVGSYDTTARYMTATSLIADRDGTLWAPFTEEALPPKWTNTLSIRSFSPQGKQRVVVSEPLDVGTDGYITSMFKSSADGRFYYSTCLSTGARFHEVRRGELKFYDDAKGQAGVLFSLQSLGALCFNAMSYHSESNRLFGLLILPDGLTFQLVELVDWFQPKRSVKVITSWTEQGPEPNIDKRSMVVDVKNSIAYLADYSNTYSFDFSSGVTNSSSGSQKWRVLYSSETPTSAIALHPVTSQLYTAVGDAHIERMVPKTAAGARPLPQSRGPVAKKGRTRPAAKKTHADNHAPRNSNPSANARRVSASGHAAHKPAGIVKKQKQTQPQRHEMAEVDEASEVSEQQLQREPRQSRRQRSIAREIKKLEQLEEDLEMLVEQME